MPGKRRTSAAVGALLLAALLGSCASPPADEPVPPATSTTVASPAPPSPAPSGGLSIIAALGDSITAAFNATTPFGPEPEYSWSTGTDPEVESLFVRLQAGDPGLEAANLAVPGAEMASLATQAQRVPQGSKLVTVLLGANDACARSVASMTPVADFRSSLRRGLAVLADAEAETVLLASVPNLYQLWEVGRESPEAIAAWTTNSICPTMLAHPRSTATVDEVRREAVQAQVAAYNKVLAAECGALAAAAPATRCQYDGGAVTDYEFTLEEISTVDYFHPSPSGQAKLAAAMAASLPTS